MIEKERLEELIEQGAEIYEVKYGKVNQVSLKNKIRFVSEKYPVIVFEPRPNEKYKHHKYFDKLYETQEKADWVAKMHTERTEKFEPPFWEDIEIKDEPYTYSFSVPELHCRGKVLVLKTYISVIWGYTGYCEGNKPFGKTTKENYIKAVEYARKLFKGEEV